MKSLLFFVLLIQTPCNIFGAITVHHKLTKGMVLQVQHEFFPFNFEQNSQNSKGHLVISNPIDACTSINPPPKSDLHSVRKGAILQQSWILLADDTGCDVHYKIVQAQRQGYTGVIIYSNKSAAPDPMTIQSHLTHVYEVNVSFIGLEDGLELKKYAFSKPYVLTIERDWSLQVGAEEVYDYLAMNLNTFYEWIQSITRSSIETSDRVRSNLRTFFQVLLLTSPIWFLIGCSWKNYGRVVYEDHESENWFRDHNQYTRYDDHSKDQNRADDHKPEYYNSYDECRKLLGISKDATKAQVESAFRRKSATYHPDKNRHLLNEGRNKELEAKTEIFRKMNNAKDKLLEQF